MMRKTYAGILAAGRGSRLGNLKRPKPLLTVKDKPMMENAVKALYQVGFKSESIICVIGHLGEQIKNHFGQDLTYLEQHPLNGNAGAVEAIHLSLEPEAKKTLLIIQGDDSEYVTQGILREILTIHERTHSQVTLTLTSAPDPQVHNLEFRLGRYGQVEEIIPCRSIDSTGRYMTGIFLFESDFLHKFLPILKSHTPHNKELGIAGLLRTAVSHKVPILGVDTEINYIAINTIEGLRRARQSR